MLDPGADCSITVLHETTIVYQQFIVYHLHCIKELGVQTLTMLGFVTPNPNTVAHHANNQTPWVIRHWTYARQLPKKKKERELKKRE